MSKSILRVLYEIRLCWSDKVFPDQAHFRSGLWMPDAPHNREKLDHAAAAGNKLYGHETHWVDKRQA
ncbi:hypothetical protein J7E62_22695 [Variovorax paradoxus]|nr:hypothetical protein [Variovorax paradoxus]